MRHTCHWTGCTREVPPAMWGCKEHWFKLPLTLRNAIWREYKPGQEITKTPSVKYVAVVALVQNWIAGKVEIRKDGSVFLKGDIEVGGHTLPVGADGRLVDSAAAAPPPPESEPELIDGPRTGCPACNGNGCDRCIPDEFLVDE